MQLEKSEVFEEHPIVNEIRQILLHDWDPIGIGQVESMADEYDSYLYDLLCLAELKTSQIEDYRDALLLIKRDFMEFDGDIANCTQAAEKIYALVQKYS